VLGNHLLVGQSYDGATAVATVYDHTIDFGEAGNFVQELSGTDPTSTVFGMSSVALEDGFAIGDADANGFAGRIYIFKEAGGPSVVQSGGTVTVTGSNDAGDNILVRIVNGSVQVLLDGNQLGPNFIASTVTNIIINAGDGDDVITSDSSNTIATEIHGGDGNDSITGGGGNDILFGEGDNDTVVASHGNDVAVGGDGNDSVFGGNGRDVLIGGTGSDSLEGENADDILVAGSTDHDASVVALGQIRTAWLAGTSYAVRVDALTAVWLNVNTVHDDGVVDSLTGGNGMDWFLVNEQDDMLGAVKKGEEIAPIV